MFIEEVFGCYKVVGVGVAFGEDEKVERRATPGSLGRMERQVIMIASKLCLTRYCTST